MKRSSWRFRQRVCPFLLDRVLGGNHEEWLRQFVGFLADRDFPFLHRLQQCRLGFGGRPVDFVRQEHICKHRPCTNRNSRRPPSPSSSTFVPVMSEGIRSGVNWIRLNCTSRIRAMVLTTSVFARPGTPTSRQCPPVKIAARICSITASWPTTTLCSSSIISSRCFLNFSRKSSKSRFGSGGMQTGRKSDEKSHSEQSLSRNPLSLTSPRLRMPGSLEHLHWRNQGILDSRK